MLASTRQCRSSLQVPLRYARGAHHANLLHPTLQSGRTFASTGPSRAASQSRFLSRAKTAAKYSGLFCLSSAFGLLAVGAGIFLHDAFTYSDKHVDRVPINPLALHPEKGGPNNLPVVKVLVDDEDDHEHKKMCDKPRLVIVGGGWGVSNKSRPFKAYTKYDYICQAVGVLNSLHPGDYHVTVVSTETYNTFTPLLPCTSPLQLPDSG